MGRLRERSPRIWGTVIFLFCFSSGLGAAPAQTFDWKLGPPLTLARSSACAIAVAGHLYVIAGGWSDPYTALTSVEHSVIQADGRPTTWRLTSRLITPRVFLACAILDGYLYAVGGERFQGRQPILLNSVERARIRSDGELDPWEEAPPLSTPRRAPVAISTADAIYVIGGYNGTFLNTIERARRTADGRLGPWELLDSRTTVPRYIHAGLRDGDHLYLLGGHDEVTGMANNRTEWTRIRPDGDLAPWREGPPLTAPRFLSGAALVGRKIYLFGGSTGRVAHPTIERMEIGPGGSPGASGPAGRLSADRSGMAVAQSGERVYLIGGLHQGEALALVEFAHLK